MPPDSPAAAAMDLPAAIRRVAAGDPLRREEMGQIMHLLMSGTATAAQIGAFLTALMIKGETVEEIVGAATAMRALAAAVRPRAAQVVDAVGTGGDVARLFNVTTGAALVAAAAGVSMAKHGNRAATGNSGSADVLEAAGVNIALTPPQVAQCIDHCGIGFMFAPTHHAATRHVIGARREIGVRTLFNLLGPLTNPAAARHQLVGVFARRWVRPLAEVFAQLGSVHTLVVWSEDGLDEISTAAATRVAEYRDGAVREYTIAPQQFGMEFSPLDGMVVADPAASLAMLRAVLGGARGAAYDMTAMNAGATLYAADAVDSLGAGVTRAREVLDSGAALEKLAQWAAFSAQLGGAD